MAREQHATELIERPMGEYLGGAPALGVAPVQQSFLSYFNTIAVSPEDGACLSWSAMHALLLMPPCVRKHLPDGARAFILDKLDVMKARSAALRAFNDFFLICDF